MPCDTRLRPNQTIEQRKQEIRDVVAALAKDLASGKAKAKVGPQGAVAFEGATWDSLRTRSNMTDNCAYRRLMTSGSAAAKMAIAAAEQRAGRAVNKQVVNGGTHSHDGGRSWHSHKG